MTASALRAALGAVIAEQGCSLQDLTVLAQTNDPFRLDTPARHVTGSGSRRPTPPTGWPR